MSYFSAPTSAILALRAWPSQLNRCWQTWRRECYKQNQRGLTNTRGGGMKHTIRVTLAALASRSLRSVSFSSLDGVKTVGGSLLSQRCPEAVDRLGASLWVLREPPVGQSIELCDLGAGAGTCAATLLVGARQVVLAGHNRQAWS
jgi:hypothetical protein